MATLPFFGLKIAKSGYNVLTETNPNNLIFSSDYNTLKYHLSGSVAVEATVDSPDQIFIGYFSHNLGYYPYVEAYVLDFDSSEYKPIPMLTAGARTSITYGVQLTTTQILFRIRMVGYAFDTYNFIFKYFIFRNNLGL